MAVITQNQTSLLGELFQSGKHPNSFLRLLGGIGGQVQLTSAKEFPIGVFYALRTPSQPAVLEGANAPAPQNRTFTQATNVIQIHQEAATITYLAMSDKTMSGVIPLPQGPANGPVQNPRNIDFQIGAALDTISQDFNFSCLNGVFSNPADPSGTALKTRGLNTAIVTNYIDHSADTGVTPAMYRAYINGLLLQMIASNGYLIDEHFTLIANPYDFSNICAAYENIGTQYLNAEQMIFGVKVRTIFTRFGIIKLVLDPDQPLGIVTIANMSVMGIVGMDANGRGVVFAEELAKVGSALPWQVYGQIGLDHGPEYLSGKFKVAAGISL
jgi:hypothetical protein